MNLIKVVTRKNEGESCLHLTNAVLFSWTWVTSFVIFFKQIAVFFWQSIENARVDGKI